ncbi:fimbrial protein [Mesorhizobium sp. A623]
MTRPHADEDKLAREAAAAGKGAEKPLDPHVENVRRKLIRFMGVNLGLLFLALMVVIVALVYKSRGTKESAPATLSEIQVPAGEQLTGDIVLPVGAAVVSQSISGNRLSIQAELVDGSRVIFIYDVTERRMIGHFAIRNK